MLVAAKTSGATPLVIACRNGHYDVAEYLIERCHADLEQPGSGKHFILTKPTSLQLFTLFIQQPLLFVIWRSCKFNSGYFFDICIKFIFIKRGF